MRLNFYVGFGPVTKSGCKVGVWIKCLAGRELESRSGLGNAFGGGLGRSSRIEPGVRSILDRGLVYKGGSDGMRSTGLGVGCTVGFSPGRGG